MQIPDQVWDITPSSGAFGGLLVLLIIACYVLWREKDKIQTRYYDHIEKATALLTDVERRLSLAETLKDSNMDIKMILQSEIKPQLDRIREELISANRS